MQKINVRETRQHISRILDAVAAGKNYIITRRGVSVARLSGIQGGDIKPLCFPDRADFRAKLPKSALDSARLIRGMRDERG